jgi:hypothetical protein
MPTLAAVCANLGRRVCQLWLPSAHVRAHAHRLTARYVAGKKNCQLRGTPSCQSRGQPRGFRNNTQLDADSIRFRHKNLTRLTDTQ